VSSYGLDDRAIAIRSLAKAKGFSSSLCGQTGSGAHLASCTMGTGDPIFGAGLKRGRGANLTTHSHLMPRLRMSRSYKSSHPSAFVACSETAFSFRFKYPPNHPVPTHPQFERRPASLSITTLWSMEWTLAPKVSYCTPLLMRHSSRVHRDREHRISLLCTRSHDSRFAEGGKVEVTMAVQVASVE
jgi:hypothetical protein